VKCIQVTRERASLNDSDVFILDDNKLLITVWQGSRASPSERNLQHRLRTVSICRAVAVRKYSCSTLKQPKSILPQLRDIDYLTLISDENHLTIAETFANAPCNCTKLLIENPAPLGWWGHGSRNKWQRSLPGAFHLHADDDDFYTPDAFEIIRSVVTSLLPRELFVAAAPNTVSFEAYPALREAVFDLLSLSTAQADTSDKLASLLCCLPEAAVPANIGYEHTFRVVISQFLDRYNFDLGTVKRSCVHFVQPDGAIIPFDTFNLFYRPGAEGAGVLAAARA
jgi:hypothetical protein